MATEESSAEKAPRAAGKRAAARSAQAEPVDFERSLGELESLVERLEAGELSLEESLQLYERGVTLSRVCQRALASAEQRVEMLAAADAQAVEAASPAASEAAGSQTE